MDSLSKILELCQGRIELDKRCKFSGNFNVSHCELPKNQAAFHLILSGSCYLHVVNHEPIKLNPGCFVLLPKGSDHAVSDAIDLVEFMQNDKSNFKLDETNLNVKSLKNNNKVDFDYSLVTDDEVDLDLICGRFLYNQGARTLLMQNLPKVLLVNLYKKPGIDILQTLVNLLRSEISNPQIGSSAIINDLTHIILTYALRSFGLENSLHASWLELIVDKKIGKSIEAILSDPSFNWTLDNLAKQVSMSRATYARYFKQKNYISPAKLLLIIRMLFASKIMLETKKNIPQIAESVGYQSDCAFNNAFKLVFGQSPAKWRK